MRQSLELGRQLAVSLLHVELLDCLRNQSLEAIELLGVERFLDVVVGTLAHRLYGRVDRSLPRHDDAFRRDRQALELLEKSKAVELRHLEVSEDNAERSEERRVGKG